ncbi:MAG: beta-hydroxyacyl-ACP dehydratase [Planctomycetes bacterium]|nr:beta-hydroxyacyl-ACP dehydratase [Planctomycetota bacterium]
MPPKTLIDIENLDTSTIPYGEKELDALLPQTGHMRQVHGVYSFDKEKRIAIGYRDVRDDEFWCEGHFPGFPVFPGVLMVEAAAQMCVFYFRLAIGLEQAPGRAMLFGGIDEVKFRGAVVPGDRIILVTKVTDLKIRRSRYDTQAFVNGKVVFSGKITGLLGPPAPQIYPDGK